MLFNKSVQHFWKNYYWWKDFDLNENWWMFWHLLLLFKTIFSGRYTKDEKRRIKKMHLVTRMSLSLSSIFLKLRSDKLRVEDNICNSRSFYLSNTPCRRHIIRWIVIWLIYGIRNHNQAVIMRKNIDVDRDNLRFKLWSRRKLMGVLKLLGAQNPKDLSTNLLNQVLTELYIDSMLLITQIFKKYTCKFVSCPDVFFFFAYTLYLVFLSICVTFVFFSVFKLFLASLCKTIQNGKVSFLSCIIDGEFE